MAVASVLLIFLSLSNWVTATNDMSIDQDSAPIAGATYTLSWSNLKGSIVWVDLDEVTNPGSNPDTHAGVRIADGVDNTGNFTFFVPPEVRSNVQYQFQIRNNADTSAFSFSNSFNIYDASGTGLPSIAFSTASSGLVFGITTESALLASDSSAAAASTSSGSSPTTDSSSPSSSSPSSPSSTSGSNSQPSSSAPPTTSAPGTSSASSHPTNSSQSKSSASPVLDTSSHLSDGAIIGIAISMLFLGLAISAAAFFLFRRRRRRQQRRRGSNEHASTEMQVNPYSDKEVHSPNSTGPSDGSSPITNSDRQTWMSSTQSPLSELAANPVQGSELEGSEYSPPSENKKKSVVGSSEGDQSEASRGLLELPERGSSVKNPGGGGGGERQFRIDG